MKGITSTLTLKTGQVEEGVVIREKKEGKKG